MEDQISEILRYSKEWRRIGIETCICNVEKIMGIRKLHRFSIKITDELEKNPQRIPTGINFLGVILSKSPIMCLDIENEGESIEQFHQIIIDNGIKMGDMFGERSLNGGIHLYFRIPIDNRGRNQYKKSYKNLNYDLLFTGKCFTVHSFFKDKRYERFNRSIFDINSINDIPHFPESLNFLL